VKKGLGCQLAADVTFLATGAEFAVDSGMPMPFSSLPKDLPIYDLEIEIARALSPRDGARLVLEAPTGSGKSTQVPQMLLDMGIADASGEILVMQPRRLAARLLAMRVASERGGRVGEEVGYTVRFENVANANTRICYVTEGILVRRLLDDPKLLGVSAIVFDEFHERHLFGDIALARVLDLQETTRPDLKVVVMSATLAAGPLLEYMAPCERLTSEGRTFPVDIVYAPPKLRVGGEVWDAAARMCEVAVSGSREGDVLIFMPGSFEIHRTIGAIENKGWARDFDVLPLYGELTPQKQDAAVARSSRRKIIVSTNVAETSVTIDGVRTVIDSGLAREADFDARRGINTLMIEKISRASADQRSGRAGRTAPGVCYRLWSETDHARREAARPPEILRLDLSETVLFLKTQGAGDLGSFRWLDTPEPQALKRAVTLLQNLGALDREGEITSVGRRMTSFPVHPRFARMLIEAGERGCLSEVALSVALCQGRSLWARNSGGDAQKAREALSEQGDFSDFQPLIRAWNYAQNVKFNPQDCGRVGIHANAARDASRVVSDLLRSAKRMGISPESGSGFSAEGFGKSMLSGFTDQLAKRRGKATLACAVSGGRRGNLAKDSIVKSDVFVAAEIVEIEGKEVNVMLNLATAVEESWLQELYPDELVSGESAVWDTTQRRVLRMQETRFRDLVLESKHSGEADADAAAEILAREVCAGNLVLKMWDDSVEQWIARVNFLSRAVPEIEMPLFSDEDKVLVISQVCQGARGYKEIKDRPVWPSLKYWLSGAQRDCLDKMAPESVTLSNGRCTKVKYREDDAVISVILQHLYDVNETPRIVGGQVSVLVEVLAPNRRPAQTTRDLAGFWKTSYEGVKKELKGRYPRHEWR
jgi:ATP-dependent helicase HrpB